MDGADITARSVAAGKLAASASPATGALTVADAFTAAMVTMTGKPSASGRTLLDQVSGYTRKNITLSAGWYWADIAGSGGGGSSVAIGGTGGKLAKTFFITSGAGGGGSDKAGGDEGLNIKGGNPGNASSRDGGPGGNNINTTTGGGGGCGFLSAR